MFDISFLELSVIALVALLVIGPEQLPKVARTIGSLMGRVQRFIGQVKEEVGREGRFEELQRLQGEMQQGVQTIHDNTIGSILSSTSAETVKQQPPAKRPATAKTTSKVSTSVGSSIKSKINKAKAGEQNAQVKRSKIKSAESKSVSMVKAKPPSKKLANSKNTTQT